MPVYNAGEYLRPALLSIINQTYSNWELIIADDGSTDGCLDNLAELNDSRIRVLRDNTNKGIAVRLNQMIDLAKGEYIARMDADDISLPNRLELQIKAFEKDGALDLLATRAKVINKFGDILGELPFRLSHEEICAFPWRGFYMAHPSWMGKTGWFKHYRYKIPAPYLCEDQDLLLRSYSKSQYATLDHVLLFYRKTSKPTFKKLLRTRLALLRCQLNFFWNKKNYLWIFLTCLFILCKVLKDVFSCVKSSLIGTR
jgi:glycosyltransferase involved in cell wall biosynthesis